MRYDQLQNLRTAAEETRLRRKCAPRVSRLPAAGCRAPPVSAHAALRAAALRLRAPPRRTHSADWFARHFPRQTRRQEEAARAREAEAQRAVRGTGGGAAHRGRVRLMARRAPLRSLI